MSPDPLRPPPPVGPRPRPSASRNWVVTAVLVLVGVALPTTLLLLHGKPGEQPTAESVSDRFVHDISTGTAPSGEPGGLTGFQAAHELLSVRKREALPFDVFFDEWQRLVDSHGLVVDTERTSPIPRDRATKERREVTYLLYLGGETQDHALLATVELKLTMAWDRALGRFVVTEYVRNSVPNPRASR